MHLVAHELEHLKRHHRLVLLHIVANEHQDFLHNLKPVTWNLKRCPTHSPISTNRLANAGTAQDSPSPKKCRRRRYPLSNRETLPWGRRMRPRSSESQTSRDPTSAFRPQTA